MNSRTSHPGRRLLFAAALFLGVLAGAAGAEGRDVTGDFRVMRTAVLYERPSSDSRILRMIRAGTVVRVVEVTGDWYRVQSSRPDRPSGYVRRSFVAPAEPGTSSVPSFRPGVFRVTQAVVVHAAPSRRARKITTLRRGTEVKVVRETEGWYRIESETGRRPPGYVQVSALRRVRNLD